MKDYSRGGEGRVEALIQALPAMHQYRGKTVVVKYGGNAMINAELKAAVIQDLLVMAGVGIRTVLVHGGGPEIEAMLNVVGKESRFIQGLRYTDEKTMEIVQMVLCGKVNKDITALIQRAGGRALGLSGIDGGLLRARRLRGPEDLGLVGEIEAVDTGVLTMILDSAAIPVVSSVALAQGEEDGNVYSLNINADTAAAWIAAALGAEKLILMTDVRGILRDSRDPDSLITRLDLAELAVLEQEGVIHSGMIPKVECCRFALEKGVGMVHIIDGRFPHVLLNELFTDEPIGTTVFFVPS